MREEIRAALAEFQQQSQPNKVMGVKEVRVTRGRIAALYRAKEKHDVERERNRKNILGIIQRLRSQAVNVDVVERDHYIIPSEGGIRMLRWIVKKLFSKNAHPALFLRNKKVSLNETNWICENCVQIKREQGIERNDYTHYILFHK